MKLLFQINKNLIHVITLQDHKICMLALNTAYVAQHMLSNAWLSCVCNWELFMILIIYLTKSKSKLTYCFGKGLVLLFILIYSHYHSSRKWRVRVPFEEENKTDANNIYWGASSNPSSKFSDWFKPRWPRPWEDSSNNWII